jgi:hypothetical protein
VSKEGRIQPEPSQKPDIDTLCLGTRSSRRYAVEQAIARARRAQPWHETPASLNPESKSLYQLWSDMAAGESIEEEPEKAE